MTNHDGPGWYRRCRSAIERWLLGRSGPAYLKQFTGGGEDRDRVPAGQQHGPAPAADASHTPAGVPAPIEYEPVHGWTRRQRDEYLDRNPEYRPAYEAELKRRSLATRGVRESVGE